MRYIFRLMSLASVSLIANTNFVFVGLAESLEVFNAETNTLIASYPLPPVSTPESTTLAISRDRKVASLIRGVPPNGTNSFQIFDPIDFLSAKFVSLPNTIFANGSLTSNGEIIVGYGYLLSTFNTVARNSMLINQFDSFFSKSMQISNNGEFICGQNGTADPLKIIFLNSNASKNVTYPDGSTVNIYTFFISTDSTKIYAIPAENDSVTANSYPLLVIDPATGFIEQTITLNFPSPIDPVFRLVSNEVNGKVALQTLKSTPEIWIVDLENPSSTSQALGGCTSKGYGVIGRMAFSKDANYLYAYNDTELYKIEVSTLNSSLIKTFNDEIFTVATIATSIEGRASKTQGLSGTDYFNQLEWEPLFPPTKFLIYRNQEFITTLEGGDKRFEDHYLEPKKTYNYEVFAVWSDLTQSSIGQTTVTTIQ
ncbi:MAG: hypothetical protein ACOYK9_06015 [Chlamydiia bacterium]